MSSRRRRIIDWWGGSAVVYDTDAQTGFDYVASKGGTLTPYDKADISARITELKAASLWTSGRPVYFFRGGNAASHALNWRDQRDLDAAYRITWHGGVTHDSTGVKFDGVSGYGDTHLNALTVFGTNYLSMHNYTSQWTAGIVMDAGDNNYDWSAEQYITNGNTGANISYKTWRGLHSVIRKDAAFSQKVFNGKLAVDNISEPFVSNGNANFLIGKHYSGFYSDALVGFSAIYDNLSVAQCATLSAIVEENQYWRDRKQRAYFFGDSNTMPSAVNPETQSFAALICASLNYTNNNRGVSGTPLEATGSPITNNLYSIRTSAIPNYVAGRDALAVISHGINDCGYNDGNHTTTLFKSQERTIIDLLVTNGWPLSKIKVQAGWLQDGWGTPWGGVSVTPADDTRYQSFVVANSDVATEKAVQFIDQRTVLLLTDLTADKIHLNASGHSKSSDHFLAVVT